MIRAVAKDIAIARQGTVSIPEPVKIDTVFSTGATFRWSYVPQELSCGDGFSTRYTLRRNTASVIRNEKKMQSGNIVKYNFLEQVA